MRSVVVLCAAAAVGIAAGLGLTLWHGPEAPAPLPPVQLGDPAPSFDLEGLDGRPLNDEQFAGRPLLINFWATWCAPCVREMPMLDAFHREHVDRLALLGIAHDRPEAARAFVEQIGVRYPNALGGERVDRLLAGFGNADHLLPYTVLVDARGRLAWWHLGELKPEVLDRALAALTMP